MDLAQLNDIISRISFEQIETLRQQVTNASQVIIIGNGGSNAIASHIAIDYQKFLRKKVLTITDTGMLSMLVNDYGSDNAYSKFIQMNYSPNTLVILISSSGNSKNIVNALQTAKELDCNIITLSGFGMWNLMNEYLPDLGSNSVLNYYVPSNSYGVIENAHQIFLHSIIDA
jgi:D-sedoheptulose 7-phosphate isomerase